MEKEKQSLKKERKPAPMVHDAAARCKAVLSIWTERRSPADVCRELGITWTILSQWQDRALEGMLQALEPRVQLSKGPALSPRLLALLAKKRAEPAQQLTNKLKALQEPMSCPKPELLPVNSGG